MIGARGATVVATKEDECIFFEAFLLQFVNDATNCFVERCDHGKADAFGCIGGGGDLIEVGLLCLEWIVRRIEGHIQEERLLFVLIDEADGFLSYPIGDVGRFFYDLPIAGNLNGTFAAGEL